MKLRSHILHSLLVAGPALAAAYQTPPNYTSLGPRVINNENNVTIQNRYVTNPIGDCVQITNSTKVTIKNSEIGKCKENGSVVKGGGTVNIYDKYIHPEGTLNGRRDETDGVFAEGVAGIKIQRNVIAFGEANIEVQRSTASLHSNRWLMQLAASKLADTNRPAPAPASAPAPAPTACSVLGGSSSAPTSLSSAFSSQACTQFNLGDGYYSAVTITRPNIVIKAVNKCGAIVKPELSIQAQNVTVEGVSVTATGVAVTVYKSGVKVLNSCIQGFGKTQYGNGIWIFQLALDPNNKIIIDGNELSDWGGAMYSGGIAIGKADDNYSVPSTISVEVRNNRITGGPTQGGIYNAAIQSFHPFLAYKNYVHTVSGTSFQNKTFNSRVACNEAVNVIGGGALYNRRASNNVWEYNLVHDSDVGIDHFMGDGTVYRGNIFYNMNYFGRVKDQGGIGSTNVTFENNTFYNSFGWAGFIWDNTRGGPLSNIMWRNNIFHTVKGVAISTSSSLDPVWDETSNIFFKARRPTGTTGASGTSLAIDPLFVNPPTNFSVQTSNATGKGAPFPLPCP